MEEYPLEYYEFFIKFNEGEYYTCHDLLEEIWLSDKENFFLKGMLQMTVALYHYEYGNVKGARMMMEAARDYIQPYRPFYWGVNLEEVNGFIEKCLATMPPHIDRVPFTKRGELPSLPTLLLYLQDDI